MKLQMKTKTLGSVFNNPITAVKKTLYSLLICLAVAGAAHAGPYSMPKGVIPPPTPTCMTTWFAGGSAGSLSGGDADTMYTGHFGAEINCPGKNSHSFFLEVGITEIEKTVEHYWRYPKNHDRWVKKYKKCADGEFIRMNLEADIIPITLNYKFERELGKKWKWYVGAGAGIALVDLDITDGYDSKSFDDTVFYAHFFAGISFQVNNYVELYAGVRYIYMGDADLSGHSDMDKHITLDGNLLYELGARVKF